MAIALVGEARNAAMAIVVAAACEARRVMAGREGAAAERRC